MTQPSLLSSFQQARVLVVGDVMLDRYWFGDVSRISPEAPVPIAKIERIGERAGGAANVVRNIAALGGHATLIAITGDDEAANALDKLLAQDNISNRLVRDASIATTVKLRVVARNQQLIRLDFEEAPPSQSIDDIAQQCAAALADCQLLILSDYGKGCLAQVETLIAQAKAQNIPILIDPKGSDYHKYTGATLLTPNRSEFREVAGNWQNETELTEKAQALRETYQLEALLLTRSEEGMSLYQAESIQHQATRAQEVYDVSGAGDTVIAAMGLSLAAGLDFAQAMHIANAAAGVVVAKLGTATCSYEELLAALADEAPTS